jgi:2-polyprenyl-6-methoxyphenol hydroxylase-like FAD-dependent oxidoreductase
MAGMNLGICDAIALSKAIADHIKSDFKDDAILVRYAEERSETIRRVVGLTNQWMSVITGATVRPALIPALRWVLRTVVNRLEFMKERLSYSVAGLNNRIEA